MASLSELFLDYLTSMPRTLAGKPFVYEDDGDLTLHFNFSATQSRMSKSEPDKLLLGYTRTMMGFLLFHPNPAHIGMIGLGGGSLAKYCLRHVPAAHFTAVDINPHVIALRDTFAIPADSPNFKVICADGADYVRDRSERVDALLVDGFDRDGLPGQLSTAEFYNDCRNKLKNDGVMAVNLLCSDTKLARYTERIRDSFDDQVVIVDGDEPGNMIAFAYKGNNFPPLPATLRQRTRDLRAKKSVAMRLTAQKIIQQLK